MFNREKLDELFASIEAENKRASDAASRARDEADRANAIATRAYADVGRFRTFMEVARKYKLLEG